MHQVRAQKPVIPVVTNDHLILACALPLIGECTQALPFKKLLFTIWKISSELQSDELTLTSSEKDKDSRVKTADGTKAHKRTELVEKYQMLCRDVYTVLPLYWAYLQHHRYALTALIVYVCVCLI